MGICLCNCTVRNVERHSLIRAGLLGFLTTTNCCCYLQSWVQVASWDPLLTRVPLFLSWCLNWVTLEDLKNYLKRTIAKKMFTKCSRTDSSWSRPWFFHCLNIIQYLLVVISLPKHSITIMVFPLSIKFSIYSKTDSVGIAPVILGIVYFGI